MGCVKKIICTEIKYLFSQSPKKSNCKKRAPLGQRKARTYVKRSGHSCNKPSEIERKYIGTWRGFVHPLDTKEMKSGPFSQTYCHFCDKDDQKSILYTLYAEVAQQEWIIWVNSRLDFLTFMLLSFFTFSNVVKKKRVAFIFRTL